MGGDQGYKVFHHGFQRNLMRRPSLFKSMAKSFGLPFCLAAILKLIHDICQFVGPVMLGYVVDFLESTDPDIPKVDLFFLFLMT